MATFRMLADHWIDDQIFSAGTIQTTQDVGGLLPTDWTPTGNSEPLDESALTLFYNAGPQFPSNIRPQWTGQQWANPKTYWVATANPAGGPVQYSLTGLGINLSPIFE